jgi:hypothetical protein
LVGDDVGDGVGLHTLWFCRREVNFAHVAMMDGSDLSVVPGDRYRVPPRFGDSAAISGVASPAYAIALRELPRFVRGHDAI